MKLYGMLASPYVGRVVLFARLKGLDLTLDAPPGGGIKSAEFLALSPIGKMPLLEVDGAGLPESEIICEYLEDAYPSKAALPADPLARARQRLLSRLYDVYVYPQVSILFKHVNPATRDASAVATAIDALTKGIGYIEHFMEASPFAIGSHPSLAECALLPGFAALKQTIVPMFGFADPTHGNGKIARWWQTCGNDPVCGPFVKEYSTVFEAFMKAMAAGRK